MRGPYKKKKCLFHYLYLICFENGWGYVGQRQSDDPENDVNYNGSGSKEFQEALKTLKYTKFILKVIDFNVLKINLLEISYTRRYRKLFNGNLYNKIDGPPRGPFSTNPSTLPEIKEKMSLSMKRWYKTKKGKLFLEKIKTRKFSFSEEAKKKMSISRKGRKLTKEWIANIAKAGLGRKHSDETKLKISKGNLGKRRSEEIKKKMSEDRKGKFTGEKNPFYNKHHSEETKQILRENHLGTVRSEASKQKQSESIKGEKHWHFGKSCSEEMKKNISNGKKGKGLGEDNPNFGNKWTDEMKENLRKKKLKKVICYDICNNEFILYESRQAASDDLGINVNAIYNNILENRKVKDLVVLFDKFIFLYEECIKS